MNGDSPGVGGAQFRQQLVWGLRRLALWGEVNAAENGDPHVAYEAKCHAKTTLVELARQTEEAVA